MCSSDLPKELRAAAVSQGERRWTGEHAGAVSLHAFESSEKQQGYLLQTLSEEALGTESRAVLFRTNSYMQGLAARLKAAGIPYVMRERAASIYEHFIVKDICAYLEVAQGQGTREQMLRIMNRPSRYISRESLGEGGGGVNDMIRYYEEALLPPRQKKEVLETLYYFERQLKKIGTLSLVPAVNYILKAAGYEGYLREEAAGRPDKWIQWQELLEWLKEDAAKQKSLKDWISFQKEYAQAMENGQNRGTGRDGKSRQMGECREDEEGGQEGDRKSVV